MKNANSSNFDYLFDSMNPCVKHLFEEIVILFSEEKIRPCISDLLKKDLKSKE